MSYRLVVQYQEQDQPKELYSLWYLTKNDAIREGTLNVKGLYGYQCAQKGNGKILLEMKTKSTFIHPHRYEIMRMIVE